MYGEKQEEADELRLDLVDVKTLYRAQVSQRSSSSHYPHHRLYRFKIDDLMKQASQKR